MNYAWKQPSGVFLLLVWRCSLWFIVWFLTISWNCIATRFAIEFKQKFTCFRINELWHVRADLCDEIDKKKGCIIINLSLSVSGNNCFVLGYSMPIFDCIGEEKWNYYHKVTLDEGIINIMCLCLRCCGWWHVKGDPWNHNQGVLDVCEQIDARDVFKHVFHSELAKAVVGFFNMNFQPFLV